MKITLKQYGILHVPLLTSNHSYRCQHFGTIVTKILTYVKDGYSSLGVAKELIDIFDDTDIRKTLFVKIDGKYYKRNGSYVTCKINSRKNDDSDGTKGSGTVAFAEGDYNMMRGSEMYLIIAELAADNNHEDEALAALNKVREARGINAYSGTGDVLKNRDTE